MGGNFSSVFKSLRPDNLLISSNSCKDILHIFNKHVKRLCDSETLDDFDNDDGK